MLLIRLFIQIIPLHLCLLLNDHVVKSKTIQRGCRISLVAIVDIVPLYNIRFKWEARSIELIITSKSSGF